nr:hypothetical protein [Allomuricauda sp.]
MGGEGSMMHAIKSFKYNRSLLKKRKLKSKEDVFGVKSVTQLNLKKSSPKDMERIREKIARRKFQDRLTSLWAVLCMLVLVLVFYLWFS